MINNADKMKKYMTDIYPQELVLVPDDTDGKSCPFLDLQVTITDSIISTSIYDKRDAFQFPIVNFPTLTGNILKKELLRCIYRRTSSICTCLLIL